MSLVNLKKRKKALTSYQNDIELISRRYLRFVFNLPVVRVASFDQKHRNQHTNMNKKVLSAICAAAVVTGGVVMTSCSLVSQGIASVRSLDMSQYPGLNILNEAQKGMMNEYSKSTKLLLQARLAAVDALVLDAEAVAANNKGGSIYASATKIAANGKEKQKELQAQIQNITNSQDLDAINKAKSETEGVDEMIAEGYSELSRATASTNADIAATNKKGDRYIAQAMKHQAAAANKIKESHSLLQDAQIAELKLAATAVMHSKTLIDTMAGASTMEKGLIAVQFRPILYFITGLPDEFEEQEAVKAMWEEHAAKSDIKLNSKKVGSIKEVTASAVEKLSDSVSLGSFGLF